jgi:hypothetical protein
MSAKKKTRFLFLTTEDLEALAESAIECCGIEELNKIREEQRRRLDEVESQLHISLRNKTRLLSGDKNE